MSNTKSFFQGLGVALLATAVVAAEAANQHEQSSKFHSVGITLETRIKGAESCFMSSSHFKRAEKAFFYFKLKESEEAALRCMELIQKCEETFEFFGG